MKKLLSIYAIILLLLPCSLRAQVYQLPNSDFESWDGTNADAEPTSWHGFPSADCTLSSFVCHQAMETRHSKSTDTHQGSGYSCRIFSTSVIGIVANGNLTTGRIHVGSTSAANSANYNITYTNQDGFNQPFDGTPDSLRFWAKVNTRNSSSLARMNTLIHEAADVRDPIISADHSRIVAVATLNFPGNNTWRQYSVPFDYNTYSGTTPAYILTTFTTNQTPGGGNGDDEVYIDDIEMVYVATLADLQNDGVSVTNFQSNILTYSIELANGADFPVVTATATSPHATVAITQPTSANPTATMVVTQGPESMTYTIHYTFATEMDAALSDLRVNDNTIENFDPATTSYEIVRCDNDYPTISATPRSENGTVEITQPTAENPVATIVVTDRDSTRTYTVQVELAIASTDLSSLRLDGIELAGFQPDVTEYEVSIGSLVEIPVLSATAVSACATVTLTQASATQLVATAVVACQEQTKTYTINFRFNEGVATYQRGGFFLSPNPTHDRATLHLLEGVTATQLRIFNTAGQIVKNIPLTINVTELNFSDLPSGIYFVELRANDHSYGMQKIVKQ